MSRNFLSAFFLLILYSCSPSSQEGRPEQKSNRLFERLPASYSGITFSNDLDAGSVKSPLEYINVYNGGGVGIGDFNNDGLPDIYLTGNISDNAFFINEGNLVFRDMTEQAGVSAPDSWCTGVAIGDVNGDGYDDIYVCRAYDDLPALRENLLFINNGDFTFTEKAAAYGLNDNGYSITATFLDYDLDGDADLFVGNHPLDRMISYGEHMTKWRNPIPETSDHLYRNNGDGSFTRVTKEAGLLNYGWTLGVVSTDFNQDGWPDLFVSVDHSEPDRYYLNNQDGTFRESSESNFMHLSYSSMGVDAADINNDGLPDLAVVEMLATDNFNEKTKMASMNPERFNAFVRDGYQHQYMRNMLHINAGGGHFSEIGQMAGVHRTNWSWSALLADFDNDGWKDFFVTNGYLREYLDKDHNNAMVSQMEQARQSGQSANPIIANFGRLAPTTRVENACFRNNKDLTFTDVAKQVGLNYDGYSSGAAYADLDNDGDLDLIVNNTNDAAGIYRNQASEQTGHTFLRIKLGGPPGLSTTGTQIWVTTSETTQFQEHTRTRGYQSAVEGIIHFGLGNSPIVERLRVRWPDGREETLTNLPVNQIITLDPKNAQSPVQPEIPPVPLFHEIPDLETGLSFVHRETPFDDYAVQVLLPHTMSQLGPCLTSADINGDGLEDVYAGGANGQPGQLFVQDQSGQFQLSNQDAFLIDAPCEDLDAVFLDVNQDGLQDLYVVSGGNEQPEGSILYRDRLYINTGNGIMRKATNALPDLRISGGCAVVLDFDLDGDPDLFVGGRQVPGRYPSPASSALLLNDRGRFIDVTDQLAPEFRNLGMVTDAALCDLNGDGGPELIVTGEWMAATVFQFTSKGFVEATAEYGLDREVGWWNCIVPADLDADGDTDFVLGNLGWNYKYQASHDKPFHVYAADFDSSGSFDIALGYYLAGETLYPVRGRQCSAEQMPALADKFPTYKEFGSASIFEVYGKALGQAIHYEATNFSNSVLINSGTGQLSLRPLPNEAQISPINSAIADDFDQDGITDLLVAGNLFGSEVETGRADAGKGLFLRGDGQGSFSPVPPHQSGLWLPLDVRALLPVQTKAGPIIFAGSNNAPLQAVGRAMKKPMPQ